MDNKITCIPSVGDIAFYKDDKLQYLKGDSASVSYVSSLTVVGVVYDVSGDKVRIVSVGSKPSKRFSIVLRWIIQDNSRVTALPSGTYNIYLLRRYESGGTSAGLFTYSKSTGSAIEFVSQINQFFSSNGLTDWSAYTKDGISYVQYVGITTDATSYDFEVGEEPVGHENEYNHCLQHEVMANGTQLVQNQVKQRRWVAGFSRTRMDAYCRTNTTDACAPTNPSYVDGVTVLYDILPFSEANYNASTALRSHFSTYDEYLDACMVRVYDIDFGGMQYRDGKVLSDALAIATVPVGGSNEIQYPAANYTYTYGVDVPGFRAGSWHLPSLFELGLLMNNGDLISSVMNRFSSLGWDSINTSYYYWASTPGNGYYAWFYHTTGMSDMNNMNGVDASNNPFIKAMSVIEIKR